jgi:hypothetical protein
LLRFLTRLWLPSAPTTYVLSSMQQKTMMVIA